MQWLLADSRCFSAKDTYSWLGVSTAICEIGMFYLRPLSLDCCAQSSYCVLVKPDFNLTQHSCKSEIH